MMRFTVDARAFSDAMSKVSKVLRKSPLPILEEIAVHVENGLCTLTATDLDTWLVAELPARGDDVSFVFSRTKDVMKACAHFEGELAITFVPKDERDGKILPPSYFCWRWKSTNWHLWQDSFAGA